MGNQPPFHSSTHGPNGEVGPSAGDTSLSMHDLPIGHHIPGPDPDRVATSFDPGTARRLIVAAATITIVLVLAFVWMWHRKRVEHEALTSALHEAALTPPAIDVVRVQRAGAAQVVTLPGDARAFFESTLYARVSGYLEKWDKDFGDPVKKDDVLATILTPELDAEYDAAKARLNALTAEAHVAAAATQFAQVSYDRWEAANRQLAGAVSQQERDQKKSELTSATAKQEEAEAQVRLGEAEVNRLVTLESFKRVTAPYDGIVTARDTDIGDLVSAGSTAATTALFHVTNYDRIRILVDVPQVAVPDIHLQMKATATARELPDQAFTGVVDRSANSINLNTRTLRIEVLVDNPDHRLLPGMYMTVTFQNDRPAPPLRIPAAALEFGPTGPTVGVVGQDRRLTFRPVVISRDMGDAVEISSGVQDGDDVALNVGSQAVSGQVVDPHLIELPPPAKSSQVTNVTRK